MRRTLITLTALGLITAAAAAAPTQAEARDWRHRGDQGHQWRGHNNSGAAVALGIFGALAGAAIASSQAYAAPHYYQQASPYYSTPGYAYSTPYGYAGYGYYR